MKYLRFAISKLYFFLILGDFLKMKSLAKNKTRFLFRLRDIWPCAFDKTTNTGYDRHYIYHPAWAARVLSELKPSSHVDVSSILSFSTMLSAFVPTKFYDYRPAKITLKNFSAEHEDLMKLSFADKSIPSLSCMHTVEHVGLGRYGDNMNYDGDLIAMKELARVLAVNGHLLFVVPVGKENLIQFNAHRVYTRDHVVSEFTKLGLTLKEFTLIPERESDGSLVTNPSNELLQKQKYACGCFLFTKDT